ncbi:FUSC family protein [Bradyrhizobium lablabi]|uniref:FUSC family protein n=1 Tax=Bradyrhizobium lablabi TaxID=722472 RepID=UPI001BA9E93B|nr:FUSC family protein [Bradyrhizobium lablabi]MBR1119940.1 FUSC family protein [Bradyrhizobium lablabi]
MQVNANSAAAVAPRPPTFAGFPASSWAFAIRIWLACLLALYAAFWLQLESPMSSAITVAILALPTRGQGLEKAGFRLFATVIGVAASIAIAGIFSQTNGLLLAVLGAWVGLCVYFAGMLDGNRAYAATLCCITVALIAIQQIDSPQMVFPAGVARGAALTVGVLAVALINDVLAAPDYHPVLAMRLEALHRRVMAFAEDALRGEAMPTAVSASLLGEIAAVHPDIASLAPESNDGTARTTAAQSAMVDLASLLFLARALAMLPVGATQGSHLARRDGGRSGLLEICRTWLREELFRKEADIRGSLDALRAGTRPALRWRAPLFRSRRIAVESGIRAAIAFMLVAALLAAMGWPTAEVALSLVAIIIGLGATAPDPRKFTLMAVIATPIACLIAGILKYFVFNGVSEFQLLAIGLAPVVIGLSLLISLPNLLLSSLGRLSLIFTLAIFAPSNPQSYDPNVFIITCFLSCLGAILTFAAQVLIPPLSNDRRLRLLIDAARNEIKRVDLRRRLRLAPEEAAFRDATWIQQIVAASGTSASNQPAVEAAMRYIDSAAALRRCRAELDRLATGPLADAANTARAALTGRNADEIRGAAETLRETATQRGLNADPACAALVLTSVAFIPSEPAIGSIQEQRS